MAEGLVGSMTRGATRGPLYEEVQSVGTDGATVPNVGDIGAGIDRVGAHNIGTTGGDWDTSLWED